MKLDPWYYFWVTLCSLVLSSCEHSSPILAYNFHVNKLPVFSLAFCLIWAISPIPSFKSLFQCTLMKWLLLDNYGDVSLGWSQSVDWARWDRMEGWPQAKRMPVCHSDREGLGNICLPLPGLSWIGLVPLALPILYNIFFVYRVSFVSYSGVCKWCLLSPWFWTREGQLLPSFIFF